MSDQFSIPLLERLAGISNEQVAALIAVAKAARPYDIECDCEDGERCDTYLVLHRALARFDFGDTA